MSYHRRVVKRRSACMTDEEWLSVVARGKLPRPDWVPIDDRDYPPPDVDDLVKQKKIMDLKWRLEQLCMALAKPSTSLTANGSSPSGVSRGELLKQYSELWEFLTGAAYSDGTKRQPGCMSVKCTPGGLQVTLTDPSSGSYCCLTAASLDDALLALEMGLAEGSTTWRSSSYAKPKK